LVHEACPLPPLVAADVGVRRVPVPADVIVVAIRWCLRLNLSYRDVAELLVERGVGRRGPVRPARAW
jgi:hypothetical protein